MRNIDHHVDFCVVGGGLTGMCTAIAAARRGIRVAIIQDRPVFGGNASSEIRMWICGAGEKDNRETGIIEELQLENRYRNPYSNYSLWDSILYEKIRFEPNITMLLNCTCNGVEMDGCRIRAVKAWQLTTETWHRVEAPLFADCSGDSVLAPLSGALFRYGREARSEFGETIAPEKADSKTMGMSCLMQAREMTHPQPFIPPKWAYVYPDCDCFPYREHGIGEAQNFWWLEIGGEKDTIHDTEEIRDELLKIAYGVWDHIKNHCRNKEKAANWALDWVGTLPGKRESRRYIGDHILTQADVTREGRFEDLVSYGGWPMDDHRPAGFHYKGEPTIFHAAPSPFGIPYRCLYSKNIENLFCAGRNISITHTAMSSTRVMATCATLGQAVGTAAVLATQYRLTPRGVYEKKIHRLQDWLQEDDCYLPWRKRPLSELTKKARLTSSDGDPEVLRNGIDRSLGGQDNGWYGATGSWVEYRFDQPTLIRGMRIIFDSNLNRLFRKKILEANEVNGKNDPAAVTTREMRCCYPLSYEPKTVPACMTRRFRIEAEEVAGKWKVVFRESNNYQRLVKINISLETTAVRLIPEETWGEKLSHIFAWDLM